MTIKVEGHQASLEADVTRRTDAPRKTDAGAGEKTTAAQRKGDSVEVSTDARLLTDAMKAAGESPDIRPEVVERMRKLRESGELGRDSTRLAERLIDHLLEK